MKKIILVLTLYFAFFANISYATEQTKAEEPNFTPYMVNLQKQVKSNWHPPTSRDSKRVVTLIKINKNGTLQHLSIYKSSGNKGCDDAAIAAVARTAPFEPLPEKFKGESIDIQFTLDYNVYGRPNPPLNKVVNDNLQNITYKQDKTMDYINYEKDVDTILAYNVHKKNYLKRKTVNVIINIDKSGKVNYVNITKSSGKKKYDQMVVESIKKCSFPIFP